MPDRAGLPPRALAAALDGLPDSAGGRDVWAALGRAGAVKELYRGGEAAAGVVPERLAALLAEVDGRFPLGSTLSVCVQAATALPLLATGSGPAEKALAQALGGAATVALGATDSVAGSDLTALRTEVVIGADGLELTGEKRWIAGAVDAEHLLVLARHRPGRHFTNFTWVLVPAKAPGVTVRSADSELYRESGVGHLEFDRVRLGPEYVVGRVGRGLPAFVRHIGTERLAGALWAVALCRRALASTLDRLRQREHGDGTLWDLDSVRQRFADCLVRVRALRALCDALGDRVVQGHDGGAAATLKAAAGTTVGHVLGECAQLQGAEGFVTGGIQQLRAQAALFGIGGGTTEVVLSAVADGAPAILAELDARR